MNQDNAQQAIQQKQLKQQVAQIMSCFQYTIGSYASNRRQLEQVLNQLLKAYRLFRIHKISQKNFLTLSNDKREDFYFEYYLVNNISCCYQTMKQLPRALEYMQKADKQLETLVKLIQKSELDYQSRKMQLISIHMRMAKAKLNLCGLYALSDVHMEALSQCSQTFGILEKVIDSVCDYSMGEKFHEDFLEIRKSIKDPSCQIKDVEIRNQYWNNVMNGGQSDEEVRDIFLSIFQNLYSKQRVQVRSSLGKIITKNVKRTEQLSQQSHNFLKKFNIGSIMRISPLNIENFAKIKYKADYVNLRFLHQLMVYVSVANYTVSTELRIMSMSVIEPPTLESLSAEDENTLHKKQKRIIEAERHHFLAIEIMYKIASNYLKQCPFFSRLIKIYEEVYLLKDNFQIIPEKVEQENQVTMISHEILVDTKDQYFLKKSKHSFNQASKCLLKKQLSGQVNLKDIQKMKKKKVSNKGNVSAVKRDLMVTSMSPRASNNNIKAHHYPESNKKTKKLNKSTQKAMTSSSHSTTKKSTTTNTMKQQHLMKSPRKN